MKKFKNKTPFCLTESFRAGQIKYGRYEIPDNIKKDAKVIVEVQQII